MSNAFSRLARQSSVYAVGNILAKAGGLFVVPLYGNPAYLSLESFGYLATLLATAQLALPIIGLGLSTGLVRFLTSPDMEASHEAVPFTTLLLSAGFAAAGLLGLWAIAPFFAELLLGGAEAAPIFSILAVYIVLKAVQGIPLMLVRTQERADLYVFGNALEMVLQIAGVYYLLVFRRMELEGVMWAYALAAGATAVIFCGIMLARIRWRFRIPLAGELIRFSTPLALAGVALPVVHVGDRYLMEWLAGTEALAVYGWAATLSGVLNMLVVQSFQLAFLVVGLKTASGKESAMLYRRAYRHYTIGTGYMVVGLSLLAYDVTDLIMVQKALLQAAPMVLPLSLGYLIYGYFAIATNSIYSAGRSGLVAYSVSGAALVNVALNLVLIPRFGGMGAAVATLIAYAALAFFVTRKADPDLKAGFQGRVLLTVFLLVLGIWALAQLATDWPRLYRLFWLAGLIALYPALVVATGLYSLEEVRGGWSLVRDRVLSLRGR